MSARSLFIGIRLHLGYFRPAEGDEPAAVCPRLDDADDADAPRRSHSRAAQHEAARREGRVDVRLDTDL